MVVLEILLWIFKLMCAVSATVLLGATLVAARDAYIDHRSTKRLAQMSKDQRRTLKESEAQAHYTRFDDEYKGFFEESYVPGFDDEGGVYYRGRHVKKADPSRWEYYKKYDALPDTQIFTIIEDI